MMEQDANEGYLYGVMISDGNLMEYPDHNKYGVRLTVKDSDFALKFKGELELYLGEKVNLNKHKHDKSKQYFKVETQKKANFQKVKQLMEKEIDEFDNKQLLKGIFDSEGSVTTAWRNISPEITIRIVQGKNREEVKKVIQDSNLEHTRTEKNGNDTYHFRGQNGVDLWRYLNGFTIHRKDIQVEAFTELKNFTDENYKKRPTPQNFNLETEETNYDNW